MSTYSYSIANDTLNGIVDTYALEKEIASSSITIATNSISTVSGTVTINFKAILSPAEKSTLDLIVQSHTGQKIVEPDVVEFQSKTALGIPKIAITKPDGMSKTYVSHNFCDSTTWQSPTDSTWSLDSAGENNLIKVYRAEVQFTHDVEMATLTPTPAELHLDLMAGGTRIDSESRIFKTLYDVFDLGNKHYSMNAVVDGVPGLTTVQFDYTDAIILNPAMAMSMVFSTKDHAPLGGTHCSVALVAGEIL